MILLPVPGGEEPECLEVPIKRSRCKVCGRTFGYIPPFLLNWKRYAASIVQSSFEEWAQGKSLEQIAVAHDIPCSRTVHRWIRPIAANVHRISGALRQLFISDEKEEKGVNETKTKLNGRKAIQHLLDITSQIKDQIPLNSIDRLRAPYHFVLCAARSI